MEPADRPTGHLHCPFLCVFVFMPPPSLPICPRIVFPLPIFPVISNEVSNLLAQSGCVQLLHYVQHDSWIGVPRFSDRLPLFFPLSSSFLLPPLRLSAQEKPESYGQNRKIFPIFTSVTIAIIYIIRYGLIIGRIAATAEETHPLCLPRQYLPFVGSRNRHECPRAESRKGERIHQRLSRTDQLSPGRAGRPTDEGTCCAERL